MTIDLNGDVGEGFGTWRAGDDEALLEMVTSANVACGFHAGDPTIMRRVCAAAHARGVRIGAHVGYRDLAGFGRRAFAVPVDVVRDEVVVQLGGLGASAASVGAELRYVKPHGALYHRAAADAACALAVVEAIAAVDPRLAVLGPPASQLLHLARERGLTAVPEGFVDRRYRADGSLVGRTEPGSALQGREAVAQAVSLAASGRAFTADGRPVTVTARSLCVHGDGEDAIAIARAARAAIEAAGIEVRPFA